MELRVISTARSSRMITTIRVADGTLRLMDPVRGSIISDIGPES